MAWRGHRCSRSLPPLLGIILLGNIVGWSGCATAVLESARSNFYSGRFDDADDRLLDLPVPAKDSVLFLMERGTIRQARGDYVASSRDFIEAYDILKKFETYSVSKGAATWVVNDTLQNFRGSPYERTMLHVFTAKNHLAQGHWDNAAVEARRIIESLRDDVKGDYPDDAYSLYMAAFCLQMIDDYSNAALLYRKASELLPHLDIDEHTGLVSEVRSDHDQTAAQQPANGTELISFILLGRAPRGDAVRHGYWGRNEADYVELYDKEQYLGRSYTLADTVDLAFTTAEMEEARKVAKSVARVLVKEAIAYNIEKETNEVVADLVRMVLIGLFERPDIRRWETLPRRLQVARVPCRPDLTSYDVVFKSAQGVTLNRMHVDHPLQRRKNTFISFCRDIMPDQS